jgi:hypothetical protein
MTVHFHIGRVPVVVTIGETPVAPVLRELAEKDEVLLLTGLRFPQEGQLARYIMRRWAGVGR